MNSGISTLQPPHQVAQKLSRTTLPPKPDSLTDFPDASCKSKSGAIFRASTGFTAACNGREAEKLWKIATEHSKQRWANTSDTGSVIKQTHAAAAPMAIHVNLRTRPLRTPRLDCSRARALVVSDRHSPSGFREAMQPSTHLATFISLFVSILFAITFYVLLSKRMLCATQKCSHRGRVHSQNRRHFVVAQILTSQEQKFCRSSPDCCRHQANSLLLFI